MSAGLVHAAPADNRVLRGRLYRGEIFLLPGDAASMALVEAASALLVDTFGPAWATVHERLDGRAIFEGVGRMRRVIYLEGEFHDLVRGVIASRGFDAQRTAFDPARIRAVIHAGHDNPRAHAAYFPHRDTWYANPASTLTAWVPLSDLGEEETFVFYPERFDTPVPNDSHRFDYEAWVADGWSRKIGWQDESTGTTAHYPSRTDPVEAGRPLGFACRRGDTLLFSGAHYHQTLPQRSGRTRFSLDFRFADLDDEAAGHGAPNVDDRSVGSCLVDYVHPGRPWPPR